MGDETKKSATRMAVRQVLMASAALAPAWMYVPEAAAQSVPTVNAGPDRNVLDTDGVVGENVTLQGSASPGNSSQGPLTLVWTNAQGVQIATGATPTVRLPNGTNQLTLTATDNGSSTSSSDMVIITVQAGSAGPLESAGRTKNERALGKTMDDLCLRLTQFGGEGVQLTREQDDLRLRCTALLNTQVQAQQAAALQEIGATGFNSIRTVAVEFSQTQFSSVMDRLQALRSGERGISLAGLTINSGGQVYAADQVVDGLNHAIGGGAAADSAGGLLDDRWGFWLRGNVGDGKKDATAADSGFKADQFGLTLGGDYRFGHDFVAGLSVGFGNTDVDFNPGDGSGLQNKSIAGSIYGSAYVGNLYLDGVLNYIGTDYDTTRHINYVVPGDTIDRTATGNTSGSTLSGGLAVGYDLYLGAFTLAPSVGYYYVDSKVDAFREYGASGLDLAFNEQDFKSSTGNASLRMSYAWKTSWAVIMPHVRGTYVREFEDTAEVFNVRFANDPFASSTNPTPPIVVESDTVDQSYFRLAAGLSLQMKGGLSGYVDYQRIEAFEHVSFQDFTVGLRLQHNFR